MATAILAAAEMLQRNISIAFPIISWLHLASGYGCYMAKQEVVYNTTNYLFRITLRSQLILNLLCNSIVPTIETFCKICMVL